MAPSYGRPMQTGQPSRTAIGAAGHRAAHQVLEHGAIFTDPLAGRILGDHLETALADARSDPSRRRLRLFIAVRTRFAEDALDRAVAGGVRQLVVLGAGLDTYAYRTPHADRLRMFEVDHPATQVWKRERLAAAGIVAPPSLTYAPVDFERATLEHGLAAAGFDPRQPSFFTWLGVVPYLTSGAVMSTLGFIARLEGGAEVVFDYPNPPDASDPAELTAARAVLATKVAALGEALQSAYETDALHRELRSLGFRTIEDLGPHVIRERFFPGAPPAGSDRGGHVVRASRR
jgi:methyltransferase (TIGR00027 family)